MPRKRKKLEQRRRRQHKPRIKLPSLRRLYTDACKRAKAEYPAILGIHECAPHVYCQSPDDLCRSCGYDNYQHRFWDIDKDDYTGEFRPKANFSGHVALLSDGHQDRPVVFVMWPTDTWRPDHAYGLMMGVLFHELGHVDDITRRLHVRLDTCVDITAAEEHAHRFACQRIISETQYIDAYMTEMARDLPPSSRSKRRAGVTQLYRTIMALYIDEILPRHTELPEESVREAAVRVLQSDDMVTFRRFAGSALDD